MRVAKSVLSAVVPLLLITAACGGSATPVASLPSSSPTPSSVELSGQGDKDNLGFLLQDGQYEIVVKTGGPDPMNEAFAFGFYGSDGKLLLEDLCLVPETCSFKDLPHLSSGLYHLVIRSTSDVTWTVTFHRV